MSSGGVHRVMSSGGIHKSYEQWRSTQSYTSVYYGRAVEEYMEL